MSITKKVLMFAAGLVLCAPALAQITFYEGEGFRGRAFTATRGEVDLQRGGFNDRASSMIVDGGWEVCEDARFAGRCVLLRPGNYESLRQMGLDNRVSSARMVTNQSRYDSYPAPEPVASASYEYRRRANERVYAAPVISVHAVMGPPEQHCWTEREQVERSNNPSAAGGVVGGIIGGILGHQIVGGRAQGAATVGGAIAGAAIGANAGRGTEYGPVERRCETVNRDGPPDYWDVVYRYRNVDHHVQMTAPPGRTIYVNRNGEPRQ